MPKIVTTVIALLFFVGCASQNQTTLKKVMPREATFQPSEYAMYEKKGEGKISGQAFLKTRGGDVKFAAGERVILNPVTSYSTEWYTKYVKKGIQLEEPDPRAHNYTKLVTADGFGNFQFDELPPGEYYVVTNIFWEVPSPSGRGLSRTGSSVGAKVSLSEGENVKVILNTLE